MAKLSLVLDLLLDDQDLLRVQNTKPGYLFSGSSRSLYVKKIRHLDYHPPFLAISYGRDNHEIIDLNSGVSRKFLLDHQNLDEYFSVAMGITKNQGMIAIGDSSHTRLQIVDPEQPLRVYLSTTYEEPETNLPLPRYFSGSSEQAILHYDDGSELAIDLVNLSIGHRETPDIVQIIRSETLLLPELSIQGPFILITITPNLTNEKLRYYTPLIRAAAESNWIWINDGLLLCKTLVGSENYDEIISEREVQIRKLLAILEQLEGKNE